MKTILAVVVVTIAIIFAAILGLILWFDNKSQEPTELNYEPKEIKTEHTYIPSETPMPMATLSPTATIPIATPTIESIKIMKPSDSIASITISNDKKIRTYEIMPDVDESTLKKNIGWLPGSAIPGGDGLCILMGHRDTDFSILRYAEIGDEFTIYMNDSEYKYSVSAIEIVNRDSELRFKAHNGSTLVLVTCYPFRYSGHAPQKYIVIGIMKKR